MTPITLILVLFLSSPPAPKPPQGWLDCHFDSQNIYRCKP